MNQLGPNLIRTYVPAAVGFVTSWLTARGVGVDAATQAQLIAAMTAIFTAAYYTLVRLLEERWPQAGVLLGCKGATTVADAEEWPPQADDTAQWPAPDETQGPQHSADPSRVRVIGGDSLAEIVAAAPEVPAGRRRGPVTGQLPQLRRPDGR